MINLKIYIASEFGVPIQEGKLYQNQNLQRKDGVDLTETTESQ